MATLTSCLIYVMALLMTVLIQGVAGETCPVYSGGYLTGYQHCGNGCCGRYPSYYCCNISTAAMAGIVLGGIVVICLLVFVCAYCLKKKKKPGRVIRPVQPTTSNTIVFTGTSGRYPAHSHVPMPPPYKRHDVPPPYSEHPGTSNQYWAAGQPNPPGTQAYPYGTTPMGHQPAANPPPNPPNPPPPDYSASAAPPPPSSTVPPRQYGYGQNHGWPESGAGNSSGLATPATSSSSSSAVPPPPPAASALTSRGPNQTSFGPNWSQTASNRNTVTTGNFPSRLPPLPND